MNKEIQSILIEITTKGSLYDDIINKMISPNYHQKNELISELTISFYSNEKKILEVIKQGNFKYYFVMMVKNQIHSSTSSFHKNVRQTITYTKNNDYTLDDYGDFTEDKRDIEYKELNEYQMNLIQEVRTNTKMSWFESEMMRLYYDENMSYRKIEAEYGIDHCLIFQTIKSVKIRLKKQIDENYIYNK